MKTAESRKIFFLAINTGYHSEHMPDSRVINFYKIRSGNGIYCSIVGNVVIDSGVGSNSNCLNICRSPQWELLASSISNAGSKPGIQLSTAAIDYVGIKYFVAKKSDDPINYYHELTSKYTLDMQGEILDDLLKSSIIARDMGFEHIQIHSAHGYLFSLLTDCYFNQHADYFRAGLKKIIMVLTSEGVEVSIRISMLTGMKSVDECRLSYCGNIVDLGADFIDLSNGFYNVNKNLIYPVTKSALDSRFKLSLDICKKYNAQQFILSGKLFGYHDELPPNSDIGICRDLIANPRFIIETKNGCDDCGKCHYYSHNIDSLLCGRW
ncbi:MAG: hypothetical protein ACRC8R_20175 [Aeromonas hydrophila]